MPYKNGGSRATHILWARALNAIIVPRFRMTRKVRQAMRKLTNCTKSCRVDHWTVNWSASSFILWSFLLCSCPPQIFWQAPFSNLGSSLICDNAKSTSEKTLRFPGISSILEFRISDNTIYLIYMRNKVSLTTPKGEFIGDLSGQAHHQQKEK